MKRSTLFILLFLCSLTISAKDGIVRLHDGGQIYYEEQGEGTPVILIHGHTFDRRMWKRQVEALSKEFRVITPDMRGYGKSQYDGFRYPRTYCDDVIEFMDSLHIDKAHLVGQSQGGFIVADMVCLDPERLLSATMNSGQLRSEAGPDTPLTLSEQEEIEKRKAVAVKYGLNKWRFAWIRQLLDGGGTFAKNRVLEVRDIVKDWKGFQLLHPANHHLFYGKDARIVLKHKKPKIPVLFLSGEMEHKKPSSMMKYLPNAKFIVLRDCGHMNNMEQPEEYNKCLLDFLQNGQDMTYEGLPQNGIIEISM